MGRVASLVICQVPPEKYPNSEVTGVRGFQDGGGRESPPARSPTCMAQLALRSSRQESGPSQSGDAAKDRFVFDPRGAL